MVDPPGVLSVPKSSVDGGANHGFEMELAFEATVRHWTCTWQVEAMIDNDSIVTTAPRIREELSTGTPAVGECVESSAQLTARQPAGQALDLGDDLKIRDR